MIISEWIKKNRGKLVKRKKGSTIYKIKDYYTSYPTHGTKIFLEKNNGDIVSASWREVKKMIPV